MDENNYQLVVMPWNGKGPYLRVMEKVEIPHDDDGGCFEFKGRRDKDGYGIAYASFGHGREWRTHRIIWTIERGPIPDGLQILHRCDNPPCVRLSHLFLGDQLDNMRDRQRKGRNPFGESHPKAKLSDSDVVDIRYLAAIGARGVDLASAFGVSGAVISKIVLRKAWRHVQ